MLFEDNTLYIMLRFLLILCGTFGMAASTTRFSGNYKRSLVLLGVYIIYAIVSSGLLIRLLGYVRFLRIVIFTVTVPAVILMYFIADEPLLRLVFTRVTQVLFSLYVAELATLLNYFLRGNMLSAFLLTLIFYCAVIALEFRFLRKPFLSIADTITNGWGILSMIPCSLILLGFLIALYPEHYTKSPLGIVRSCLFLAVVLVIYAVIFLYLHLLYARQMSERNTQILELQVQHMRRENESMEALEKQTRIIRHDIRHMLSVIASFAEKKDSQALLAYIDKVAGETAAAEPVRFCNDPILSTTLSSYFTHAQNMGLTLETHLSIPDVLPTDSAELAICFANALECVMRLYGELPGTEAAVCKRTLLVRCISQPAFMLEVSGPCKKNLAFGRNRLPRTEDAGLSLNINSVRDFCERHHAVCSFLAQNGRFSIQVAL